jgi:hypothetical protein
MDSAAEVCNLGLNEIGSTGFIDDLEEGSLEAQVAKTVWKHCVKTALKLTQPKFARKRAVLAAISGGERTNWLFAYTLPDDFLGLVEIPVLGLVIAPAEVRTEYEVEGNVILCNIENLEIVYTHFLENVARYDEDFVEVLALFLASKFAAGIKKDRPFSLELEQRAKSASYQYRADNFNNQDTQKLEPLTPAHRARL